MSPRAEIGQAVVLAFLAVGKVVEQTATAGMAAVRTAAASMAAASMAVASKVATRTAVVRMAVVGRVAACMVA